MIQFPRVLRRKVNVVCQATFLFLVALSLLVGFRHFKSNPSVEIGAKFRNSQFLSPRVPSLIPPLTPSRLLELASPGPSLVLETGPPKHSTTLEIASPRATSALETASPKSNATLETASPKLSPIPKSVPTQSGLLLEDGNST